MKRLIPLTLLVSTCFASCKKPETPKPLEQVIVSHQRKGLLGHGQYSQDPALRAFCYGIDVLNDKPCVWETMPAQGSYRSDFATFRTSVEQLLQNVYNIDEKEGFIDTVKEGITYKFRRDGKNAELKLHWYAIHRPEFVDTDRKDPTDWFTPVEMKMTMTSIEGRVQTVDITEDSLALQRPMKSLHVRDHPASTEPWPEFAIPLGKEREETLNKIYAAFVAQISK